MPVSLVVSERIPMDTSSRPPGTPIAGSWLSRYAQKNGSRWVLGDDKTQVLAYTGTIWSQQLKRAGSPVSPVFGWYYEPSGASAQHTYTGNAWLSTPVPYGAIAYNRAYERFKEVALGANATWGTTIAEGREALGMIGTRAFQLARAYRALRKGDFSFFLNELKVRPLRRHRRLLLQTERGRKSAIRKVARGSSAIWLEYWFGWAPLAGEIYQSTIVLTAAKTSGKHWGSSGMRLPPKTVTKGSGGSWAQITEQGKYVVKTGAIVTYSNQNSALVQQLGLANPLAIAWELVPFSFVVDWFTNVGDVLGAMTDLNGVSLSKPYTTEFAKTTATYKTSYAGNNPAVTWTYDQQIRRSRRKTSLIKPVLVPPRLSNFGHSLTRAASAVSLLTQLFIRR